MAFPNDFTQDLPYCMWLPKYFFELYLIYLIWNQENLIFLFRENIKENMISKLVYVYCINSTQRETFYRSILDFI